MAVAALWRPLSGFKDLLQLYRPDHIDFEGHRDRHSDGWIPLLCRIRALSLAMLLSPCSLASHLSTSCLRQTVIFTIDSHLPAGLCSGTMLAREAKPQQPPTSAFDSPS